MVARPDRHRSGCVPLVARRYSEGSDANPGFLASMINLAGFAAFRRGECLSGDAKVGAYTDAARRFTAAWEKITPDTQRALWVDLGFYRGAAFQALGMLADGADAIRCLDQAAASFRSVAEHGTADGTVHPIAAYNLHVVLENCAAWRRAAPHFRFSPRRAARFSRRWKRRPSQRAKSTTNPASPSWMPPSALPA